MGKSAWALNLATNAAINSNKTVAIFNLEMSAESLASRMIASLGHIEGYKLATGNLKNDWDKVNEALSNGAQAVTVGPDIVASAFKMPSISQAVADFRNDWESLYGGKNINNLYKITYIIYINTYVLWT